LDNTLAHALIRARKSGLVTLHKSAAVLDMETDPAVTIADLRKQAAEDEDDEEEETEMEASRRKQLARKKELIPNNGHHDATPAGQESYPVNKPKATIVARGNYIHEPDQAAEEASREETAGTGLGIGPNMAGEVKTFKKLLAPRMMRSFFATESDELRK
jgi:hypothetical protein